jgi:hypothetical protein
MVALVHRAVHPAPAHDGETIATAASVALISVMKA